ncbi:MAG: CoA pyrophosphatase [Candidatus Bathyarchaeota archaeon]
MGYAKHAKKLSTMLTQPIESVDAQAAVAVLLREANQGFHVLLVKRAEKASDPWSGQTALPGGKRSLEDQNLKATVVRETKEETGIDLLVGCRLLGAMEPVRSTQKPKIKILPFVVLQEKEQTIELNEELTEYFWTPLADFSKNTGTFKFDLEQHPAYIIERHVVWGLTYRILNRLLALLHSVEKKTD